MRLIEIMKLVFQGKRLMPPKETGPIAEAPDLQEDDIDFILSEHVLRKFGDREFYGPGAEEARLRRDRALGRIPLTEETEKAPTPKKRKSAREKKPRNLLAALIKKRDKLKKEIEKYEK